MNKGQAVTILGVLALGTATVQSDSMVRRVAPSVALQVTTAAYLATFDPESGFVPRLSVPSRRPSSSVFANCRSGVSGSRSRPRRRSNVGGTSSSRDRD
jgi:hypothetical protein